MLLGLLCVLAAGAELFARTELVRSSRILSRIERELHDAEAMGRSTAVLRRTVLFVGNSLLLEDVDFDALMRSLGSSGWDAHRLVIEQTQYMDWHFGLRRVLDSGAHPDVVVLVLTPPQLLADRSRGALFAAYLMRARDIASVWRETHVTLSEASALLLCRVSRFYGLAEELRKHVLMVVVPGMLELSALLANAGAPRNSLGLSGDVAKAVARLSVEREEVRARQVAFAMMIPPVPKAEGLSAEIVQAGAHVGVRVLLPVRSGEISPDLYRDGFHMNAAGADRYTIALSKALPEALDRVVGDR